MKTAELKPLVFVVDDDPMLGSALAMILEQEGMEVRLFNGADTFLAALANPTETDVRLSTPNCCAVIDVCMPDIDGLQLQGILCEQAILIPLIFLTGQGSIPMSVNAIKAGAEDFLTKPVSREKLISSVHSALQKSVIWQKQKQREIVGKKRLSTLTPREMEIVSMTIEGLPNKQIARNLDISLRTVEHHKTNILNKTGTINSLELSRLVQESGMQFI
jgi:FixJ family two-component response regulator